MVRGHRRSGRALVGAALRRAAALRVRERRRHVTRDEAAAVGMVLSLHAAEAPAGPAVTAPTGDRTFAELNGRANALVRALRRRGLGAGSAVAIVCGNRPEFAE